MAVLGKSTAIVEVEFNSCPDPILQKQLTFMLGRHQFYLELPEERITMTLLR